MKLYISGQITGLEYDDAFMLFEQAEAYLKTQGHEPVNPMKSVGGIPGKTWGEYMAEDIIILERCDGIFMLGNWRRSRGARVEHEIACVLDKHIFYEATPL